MSKAELGRGLDIKSRVMGFEESVHNLEVVLLKALQMDLVEEEREPVLLFDDLESFLCVENAHGVFKMRIEVHVLLGLLL